MNDALGIEAARADLGRLLKRLDDDRIALEALAAKRRVKLRLPNRFLRIVRLHVLAAAVTADLAMKIHRAAIIIPPGTRLRGILGFVYSKKTMLQVFDPILADMQAEWQEALVAHVIWKARWVRVRGYYSLAKAASLYSLVGLLKQAVGLWKAS